MNRRIALKLDRLATKGLLFTLTASMMVGCGSAPDSEGEEPEPSVSTPVVAVQPATSINAMMVGLIDHAAHHIWDLGRDGFAPQTDRDWDEVVHASIQLIASATAITTGGTGVMDEGWVVEPEWRQWTEALRDAGTSALESANARDLDGVLRAGDALIESCEGCHTTFKPESPTEGIVHPHYYD